MSGFVKLDSAILNSSLWVDHAARDIFITALLLAEPREFAIPLEQLSADGLNATGFVVPPGRYGFVSAAGSGIIRQAGIDAPIGTAALCRLGEADPDSRSPEYGGRRLVRVNGGYVVLNYARYRDYDYSAARRMRAYRQRRHGVTPNAGEDDRNDRNVTPNARNVTPNDCNVTRNVTHAEAEADNYNIFVPLSRHPVPNGALTPKRRMSVRDGLVVRSLRDGTLCKLDTQTLAKCIRLLWKPAESWSPHTLGAILYAVSCNETTPLRDLAVFAKGCANGKSGARSDFDAWVEVASEALRAADIEAQGGSTAAPQDPSTPGPQAPRGAGEQGSRGDE